MLNREQVRGFYEMGPFSTLKKVGPGKNVTGPNQDHEIYLSYVPAGTSLAILLLIRGLKTKKARIAAIASNMAVM